MPRKKPAPPAGAPPAGDVFLIETISLAISGVSVMSDAFGEDTMASVVASVPARIETGVYPVINTDQGMEVIPGVPVEFKIPAGHRIGVIGSAVFDRAGLGVLTITF